MKKLFLILLFTSGVLTFSFAQDVGFDDDIDSGFSYDIGDSALRLGCSFTWQTAFGDLSFFVGNHLGGAVKTEYDFRLPVPNFLKFGVSTKVRANFGFLKDDILLSFWNVQAAPGLYARFSFLEETFIIQPELSYGAQFNFPEKNPEYNNDLKKLYVDQMLEMSLGFRFSPEKLFNGNIELGVTPFYILGPEKNSSAHYAGAELSVFYKF